MATLVLLLAGSALGDKREKAAASWAPPDIDAAVLPVNSDVPCALEEVLPAASARVRDLVVNMQRFSAAEEVTFEEVDPKGVLQPTGRASFSYVADIHEAAPHQLMVQEYRNDSVALRQFPSKFATLGTAAFALIFHPDYLKDFEVTCEGQSEWRGRRAWRLRLRQSRANNFRYYTVAGRSYALMLKARAWIDAETFEVLRLETDLREPIPQIPLVLEHVIVDYALVEFPRRNLRLWLPREADIYMDCRGRQYHHRHSFSHFQLFWVDTQQTVKMPPVPPSEPSYLPSNTVEKSALDPAQTGESASSPR